MINLSFASPGPAPADAPIAASNGAQTGAPVVALGADALRPFAALPFADMLGELAPEAAPDAAVEAAPADDNDSASDAGQQQPLMAAMTLAMPLLPAALAAANAIANTVAANGAEAEHGAHAVAGSAERTGPAVAIGAAPPAPDAVAAPAPYAAPASRPATQSASETPTSAASTARYAAAADGARDPAAKTEAPAARDAAGIGGMVPAAHVATVPQGRATDSVALAGPPTAWGQSLREALGERLQVQVGQGLQQAVIRLEPPQLGRVEIAIRHSAGSLEVTLSATNGEVLRQLQGVSDSLRNDLAQRQFLDVAVTVAPAPRSAGANSFSGDAQGRGRQPGQDQEQHAPGLALFDDGADAAGFSLNGRA